MIKFKEFLYEDSTKLTHLSHLEDLPIEEGSTGFHKAIRTIASVTNHIISNPTDSKITQKYDGSNTTVFGTHPETKKFFVGTKSTFSKNPKINYSNEDIDRNHGDKPGLAATLKLALEHLPKVTPKFGVYQGDLMHQGNVPINDQGYYNFTPNTITYEAHKDSEEGKKIKKAKIGLVVHSKYEGPTLESMAVHHNVDHENFKKSKNVHLINPDVQPGFIINPYLKNHIVETISNHLKQAHLSHEKIDYSNIQTNQGTLQRYINNTVRQRTLPSVKEYKDYLTQQHLVKNADLKSSKGKESEQLSHIKNISHIDTNRLDFKNLFKVHEQLQMAKHHLLKYLNNTSKYQHRINGNLSAPEGFVASRPEGTVKLVDRSAFSVANFEKKHD